MPVRIVYPETTEVEYVISFSYYIWVAKPENELKAIPRIEAQSFGD
jgi:hypothetical protein